MAFVFRRCRGHFWPHVSLVAGQMKNGLTHEVLAWVSAIMSIAIFVVLLSGILIVRERTHTFEQINSRLEAIENGR